MARRRITSTLGQAAKALRGAPTDSEPYETEQSVEEARMVRRGRDLLHAMAGNIHTITVFEVPPGRCKMWTHHNRLYELLDERSCADLVESFRTQGQLTPVVARKCVSDSAYDYEIVCGARRHWTASYLKRDLKLEVRELNDEEAFLLSDADNKDSQDISEYERGLEYAAMVRLLYEGNQQRLADRVGLSKDVVSDYIALAHLDRVIVQAYPDPRWIKRHHGKQIRARWSDPQARERMLAAAKTLLAEVEQGNEPKDGAAVLRTLIVAAKQKKARAVKQSAETFQAASGNKMLTVTRSPRGRVSFEVDCKSGASVEEVLGVIRRQLEAVL
jgi:ParB family chromosome partitioning protein